MKNQKINFSSLNYKYPILIGKNTLNQLPKKLKIICPNTKNIALIIDKKVPLKYKKILKNKLKNYNLLFLSFSASEKNKSFNIVNYFLKILLSKFKIHLHKISVEILYGKLPNTINLSLQILFSSIFKMSSLIIVIYLLNFFFNNVAK